MASVVVMMGLGAALGCSGVGNLQVTGGAGGGSASGGSQGAGGSVPTGLPCDVAQALTLCIGCHSNPPIGGAVAPLVTWADLTAHAPPDATYPHDPTKTMAQMAVIRMQDAAQPMPPKPSAAATAAQIKTISDWIAAGNPMGTCGTTPDPTFQGAPTCPSGVTYQDGTDGTNGDHATMYPGQVCIACHIKKTGEPKFALGGTVFPTGRVVDDCQPPATIDMTKAKVVIHDANGDHVLGVTYNGNFMSSAVTFPYTAKVTYQGKERAMLSQQIIGDCNGCHTAAGANMAPGRIALPN